jgi:hypothetical protein
MTLALAYAPSALSGIFSGHNSNGPIMCHMAREACHEDRSQCDVWQHTLKENGVSCDIFADDGNAGRTEGKSPVLGSPSGARLTGSSRDPSSTAEGPGGSPAVVCQMAQTKCRDDGSQCARWNQVLVEQHIRDCSLDSAVNDVCRRFGWQPGTPTFNACFIARLGHAPPDHLDVVAPKDPAPAHEVGPPPSPAAKDAVGQRGTFCLIERGSISDACFVNMGDCQAHIGSGQIGCAWVKESLSTANKQIETPPTASRADPSDLAAEKRNAVASPERSDPGSAKPDRLIGIKKKCASYGFKPPSLEFETCVHQRSK